MIENWGGRSLKSRKADRTQRHIVSLCKGELSALEKEDGGFHHVLGKIRRGQQHESLQWSGRRRGKRNQRKNPQVMGQESDVEEKRGWTNILKEDIPVNPLESKGAKTK